MDGPAELEHRLRPWEQVLWWGRPRRAPLGLRDPVWLLVGGVLAAALATIVFVPRGWHPVVAIVFRAAIAFSALSLTATSLTVVVRQRRQTIYAITRDRVLGIGGFWAGGVRAWPLDHVIDATVHERSDGTGTIVIAVAGVGSQQIAHVADVRRAHDVLLDAKRAAAARSASDPPRP